MGETHPASGAASKIRDVEDGEKAKPILNIPAPVRPRQRALKLPEITKPMTKEMNDSMALSALRRVLKAERVAMLGGVASIRQKLLASLATLFCEDFKNRNISSYINQNAVAFLF